MNEQISRRKFVRNAAAALSATILAHSTDEVGGGTKMKGTPNSVVAPSFASVTIAGVPIPKIIIGINSLLGWSHTSAGRDRWIRKFYTPERIGEVFARCIELGITAVFGPVYERLISAIDFAEKLTGVRLTYIGTTFGDPKTTEEQVKRLRDARAPFCLIHGGWTDNWKVENGRLKDFDRHLAIIRKAGLIPGVACHNAERLRLVERGGEDCELFAIPVNKMGFYMNPSREAVIQAVNECTKPVIAIKPLASGRFDEGGIEDWLRWTFSVEGVVAAAVGFMNAEEAEEDIAIAKSILI